VQKKKGKCPKCKAVVENLSRHIRVCTKEFMCGKCERVFKTKKERASHYNTHLQRNFRRSKKSVHS
jgi:uncharacterized C2H2 Zn-finger protein